MADSTQETETTTTDLKGLLVSFSIQAIITTVIILVFSIVLRPNNRVVYEPRSKFSDEKKRPTPLTGNALSPWRTVFKLDIFEEGPDKIGLDAVMFLRFLKFGMGTFIFGTCFAIPLCFVHLFSFRGEESSSTGIQRTSPSLLSLAITNLPRQIDGNFYFLHSSLLWVFSLFLYYSLYKIWIEFHSLRKRWWASEEFLREHHNRTLLVHQNPETYQSVPSLEHYMNDKKRNLKYPPTQVSIGRSASELEKLVADHDRLTLLLEKAITAYLKSERKKRPRHREGGKLFGLFGGKQVDTIEYCSKEINIIEQQIYALRLNGEKVFKPDFSAFVSFRSVKAAHSASRQLDEKAIKLNSIAKNADPKFKLCPNYKDIVWENVGLSNAMLQSRRLVIMGAVAAIILGWSFFTLFVISLVQIDKIREIDEGLADFIDSNEIATVFVTSILGPLLLAILNLLLPIILRALSKVQGVKTISGIEKSVLKKYYALLLYQFMIAIGIQAVFDIVVAYFKGTSTNSTTPLYVRMLQSVAVGFMKYSTTSIIYATQGLVGYSVEIAQGAPLVLTFLRRKFLNLSPREEYLANQPPQFNYTVIYGLLLYAFTYSGSYAITSPLIVPFAAVVFSLAYYVMKYQLFYVYETKCESGGSFWPKIFNLVCIAIGLIQVLTSGVLMIRLSINDLDSRGPIIMALITPFLTLAFWVYCIKKLRLQTMSIPDDGDYESTYYGRKESEESLSLEDEVFNPTLAKPLKKVWLPKQYKASLTEFHNPDYDGLADYIRKRRGGNNRKASAVDIHSSGAAAANTSESTEHTDKLLRKATLAEKQDRQLRRETVKRMSVLGENTDLGGELEDFYGEYSNNESNNYATNQGHHYSRDHHLVHTNSSESYSMQTLESNSTHTNGSPSPPRPNPPYQAAISQPVQYQHAQQQQQTHQRPNQIVPPQYQTQPPANPNNISPPPRRQVPKPRVIPGPRGSSRK